ncbi:hypothetical protein C6A49_12205 [Enterobacter hormaechei]|nr:hypothetical protein C6A49_12205 [Enterobacter hormaechei]RSA34980.1 hypothetical protein EGK21_13835 [Enterobacter hormaechei]RTO79448.1 hypothetical protein EKN59_15910 [Enterobacter hormaechei]
MRASGRRAPLLPGGASLTGPTISLGKCGTQCGRQCRPGKAQPPPGFLLALLPPVRLRRKP